MSVASPVVSIIMPVYNNEETLDRAIASVVAQTYCDWELVVVDDGSTDRGFERVRAAWSGDARFHFLGPRPNTGPSIARNIGIDAARGEWLALLDGDDAWRPSRLAQLLAAADQADFVADDLILFDAAAQQECGSMFGGFGSDTLDLCRHLADTLKSGLSDTGYLKPLMRRDFLQRHGLAYDPRLRHGEDFILYLNALCEQARFQLVSYPGYVYTAQRGQRSKRKSQHSRTTRDSKEIANKMIEVEARYRKSLSAEELDAFKSKTLHLRHIDSWRNFQDSVIERQFLSSVRLFLESNFVRERAAAAVMRRLTDYQRRGELVAL